LITPLWTISHWPWRNGWQFVCWIAVIRALYPERERLQALRDDDRVIVSEPLGDLHGVWDEIPDGSALVVQPGPDEQRPFRPSAPRTAVAV
jgi:glutamine amidotransferase